MDLSKYKTENKNIFNQIEICNSNKSDRIDYKNNTTDNNCIINNHKVGRKPILNPTKKLISVYFNEDDYNFLEKIADGRPLANFIRRIVTDYLNGIKKY